MRGAYGLHGARNADVAASAAARAREKRRLRRHPRKASSTNSIATNSSCRWRERRPRASFPASSTRSSRCNWIDFGDGKPTRAFVCTSPNPWGYPAKDRSGRLEQIEEPHLGKLIAKLHSGHGRPGQNRPSKRKEASHGLRLSEAPPQRDFDLIPDGTIATVQLTIRPGGAGEGGLLKRSANGDCEMLDCEFIVVDGPLREAQVLGTHDPVAARPTAMPKLPKSAAAGCGRSSNRPAGSSPTT